MAMIESEKELEDFLYKTSRKDFYASALSEFANEGKIFRQVNIPGYGIIDLITVGFDLPQNDKPTYPEVKITIIEIKKGAIDHKALEQLARYRTAITRYLNRLQDNAQKEIFYDIKGVLIGKTIDKQGSFVYLVNNIEWLSLVTYSIDLENGLSLKEINKEWHSTTENFDSLKFYLAKIMPNFLSIYKEAHMYWVRGIHKALRK